MRILAIESDSPRSKSQPFCAGVNHGTEKTGLGNHSSFSEHGWESREIRSTKTEIRTDSDCADDFGFRISDFGFLGTGRGISPKSNQEGGISSCPPGHSLPTFLAVNNFGKKSGGQVAN